MLGVTASRRTRRRAHEDPRRPAGGVPDGKTLDIRPCSGPLYRVDTAALFDEDLDEAALEKRVSLFADVPTTGGTAMPVPPARPHAAYERGKTDTVPLFVVWRLKTDEEPPANDHP